jgi:conjugative relaxase-like TrwC/TraI family protein
MLSISKPLSATGMQSYYAKEFTAAEQNHWKPGETIAGEWRGRLAGKFSLTGPVRAREFAHLSEGQHPHSGKQLIRHRSARRYQTQDGRTVVPMKHRAGWDAMFKSPKSVSLTALAGGDGRVRDAHREAVYIALGELESYTQAEAHIRGKYAPETTGQFVAATFEHDSARPVDGYAAPHLHTHAVIFNMTERENQTIRALEPYGLFESRQFARACFINICAV